MIKVDFAKLDRPVHAIVQLRAKVPMPRDVHYAVCIDRKNISPSKKFIRFGDTQGDEIIGWQPLDDVIVCEVLGAFDESELHPARGVTQEAA